MDRDRFVFVLGVEKICVCFQSKKTEGKKKSLKFQKIRKITMKQRSEEVAGAGSRLQVEGEPRERGRGLFSDQGEEEGQTQGSKVKL